TYPLPLTTYYYTFDGMGSVSELTDNTELAVEKYTYDSFGNLTIRDTSSIGNCYTYTSREYDAETGLYFYRARYYDASVGRFLSKDPLLEDYIMNSNSINNCTECKTQTLVNILSLTNLKLLHVYEYVRNNPINNNDPKGLFPQKPGCDVVPEIFETKCKKICCEQHDRCYEEYNCTAASWLNPCTSPECTGCNAVVVTCFIACHMMGDPIFKNPPYSPPDFELR
ncbi:MAG: RHS repeat-associated core domain-containing protein, partial [Nanoarchaeota archaeon]